MKIKIDKEACIGCGACEAISSKYFEIGSDGKAKPKKVEVDKKDEKEVKEAKESCPVDAIKLE